MANLPEKQEWIDGIYQLETSDPVVGGPGGVSNKQAEQLADRTAYLKKELESTGENLQSHIKAADPHTQYAPKASPALTGTPTAPTAAQAANSNQIATTAFVKAAITTLVNGSPAALDTLQELAKALGNDPNFSVTVLNKLAEKLDKAQNGADIPNIAEFIRNIGACKAYSSGINIGGNNGKWSTAEFIAWLKSQDAFNYPYWVCKGSWSYANNKIIADTGCGDIQLAGAVVEVMGSETAMTIRVTTPSTAPAGVKNAQFIYINHGAGFSPGWRRDYNTANKPNAADVGALTDAQAELKYATLNSPALIGKPIAPTAVQTANDTQIATTAFVKAAINALINGAPGALDTLQELAKALGNDPNFSTTVLNEIAKKLPLTGGVLSGQLTINNILRVTAPGSALPESQGAHICWNRVNGAGRTDFVNHRGSGGGGFTFWNGNHESLKELASLDATGGLYVTGTISESGKRVYSPNNKPTAADVSALPISGGTLTGSLLSSHADALRLTYGSYGVIQRNDGGYFYLLLTNKGDTTGSWNTLRPFSINLATGDVILGHSVNTGTLLEKGQRVYSPNNKPTAADIGALPASGGTLTGNVTISNDSVIKWERSTDYAVIGFNCENDASTNYMYFRTGDNGNEYFRWEHTAPTSSPAVEWMSLKADGLRIKGNLAYHAGNKPTAAEVGAISVSELAGIPLPWPLATAPAGWLKCNGQAFNKTTYPKLAAAYPSGKLPDLRGEFIRGWDDARGADSSRVILSAQSDAMQPITAGWTIDDQTTDTTYPPSGALYFDGMGTVNYDAVSDRSGRGAKAHFDSSRVTRTASETRPRNIAFNYIVRAA
ncbi:tail fiber protein [Brenneria goodwinii]|uniref:phage tail protein n=1 Tax=Brenneria goodwinii TaxID=1109412 RepID=UPI0036ED23FA